MFLGVSRNGYPLPIPSLPAEVSQKARKVGCEAQEMAIALGMAAAKQLLPADRKLRKAGPRDGSNVMKE